MKLNKKSYIYISILFFIAIFFYGFILFNFSIPNLQMFLFWIILSVIVESLLIPLPNNTVGISVGYAINLAAIIVGGPVLGSTSAFLGVLFRFPNIKGRGFVHALNSPIYKTAFNVSQSIIVTGIMGIIYMLMSGVAGSFSIISTISILLIGVVLNTIIISGFISIANKQNFIDICITNIEGILPNSIAVGTIGIIIALAFIGYGYGAVILFFGPLLLARFSFKLYIEMRNIYISTIEAFNSALEAKDSYTSGHASRVEEYSVKLAEAYGLPKNKIADLKNAAILHDIGKIGIKDDILNKAGKLTAIEFEEIRKHPTIGADIITKVDFLQRISDTVRYHHERYDGSGYPEGLSGESIPIEAYILSLADSYDAMTSDRPYRKGLTNEKALEEIKRNKGTQFHPELAEKIIDIFS